MCLNARARTHPTGSHGSKPPFRRKKDHTGNTFQASASSTYPKTTAILNVVNLTSPAI